MLTPIRAGDSQRLRDFLAETHYTDQEFRSRPMLAELPSRHAGNWPYLLDNTSEPSALNVLLRLFLFGIPVEYERVAAWIPLEVLESMVEAGMAIREGELLLPAVMLTPLDRYWFAADSVSKMQSGQSANLVIWANQTTRLLSLFAVRRPSRSTLDLGAGSGVISVLASDFSAHISATDLNPRAANFTQFNAGLNGIDNIESYTGDTFAPVQGQAFDLILANPPFFITPSSSQMYCENAMELDDYCRRIVKEGAAHLNDDGYLQMTLEWVQVRGQSWQDRLAEWLDGTGCDAWIMRSYLRDPSAYAYERTKDAYAASPEAATEKFEQAVAYYRSRRVEQICGGALAMRRRSGKNWLRMEEVPLDVREPFGEAVLNVFATQTMLSTLPTDEQLMSSRPRISADAVLEQRLRPGDGRWTLASVKLLAAGELPASLPVQSQVADFLAGCDGKRTLRELIEPLTKTVSAPRDQVVQQCCAVVRKLAERRFISL